MKFAVTIDVEEEGLFIGSYSSEDAPATNVFQLERLDRLFLELGVRPTLLVSYQVVNKPDILKKINSLKARWAAEIGAHLHHWNTPPIVPYEARPPVPSELISKDLLEAKTRSLLNILSKEAQAPTSFRMGRFNLGPKMLQVLEVVGIKVDSSVSPMRKSYGGANHICAPVDPYFPDSLNPVEQGMSPVLEVPVTILPISRWFSRRLHALSERHFPANRVIEWLSMNIGSIAAQPAWVNLPLAKAGVRLHDFRGGQCVIIFFHSSELVPSMNPLNPTEEHVGKFIKRLHRFIKWLQQHYDAKCCTLSELYPIYQLQRISTDLIFKN
ncbi:MAG: hypothetical protein ACP5U1_01330 [Desulfomonilaceae bacterium]